MRLCSRRGRGGDHDPIGRRENAHHVEQRPNDDDPANVARNRETRRIQQGIALQFPPDNQRVIFLAVVAVVRRCCAADVMDGRGRFHLLWCFRVRVGGLEANRMNVAIPDSGNTSWLMCIH